jgi:methyl-accepting chemotaxis protein
MINDTKESIKKVAVAGQYIINGDEHEKITSDNSKEYNDMCNTLTEFRRKSNVYDVYTLIKKDDSHTKFVLASYAPKSTFMKDYVFNDKMKSAYYDGKVTVLDSPITDLMGTFYSAYAPLYNSDGKVVALVAVDVSAQHIINLKHKILISTILLFLLTCLIVAFISYLSAKPINRVIKSLSNLVLKISQGDFSLTFDESIIKIKEIKDFTHTINTMNENISFLINVISQNSREIELKANEINSLTDKVNLSAQVITSIIEEMIYTYKNIRNFTEEAIQSNKYYDNINFEKIYINFKDLFDNFNKLKLIYLNDIKSSDDKLIKRYIGSINSKLKEMDSLFNSTFDILQKSNDKLLPNDSFNYNYKTLQKKFDKINTANTYISDGVKEQADAIEGIVEEIADLKDISNNLNKTLKKINYSNKS